MGFAILRVQKLKSAVAVHRSAKHNYREQDTPNADPALTPNNTQVGPQNVDELMAAFNARLPEKFRKDAVQCIEFVVTGSPETMNAKDRAGQDAYLRDALDWIKATYGPQNVVGASVHRDESTPHLVAYVVPVDAATGRLNAKKWLGGAAALSAMQTEFAEKVGKPHGLERGQERSKAVHKAVRQWYAEQQAGERLATDVATITAADLVPRPLKAGTLLEKMGMLSSTEDRGMIADRITDRVRPVVAKAQTAIRENRELKREVASLRKQVKTFSDRAESFVKLLKDLTRDQVGKLVQVAERFRAEAVREREAKREAERIERAKKQAERKGPGMGR